MPKKKSSPKSSSKSPSLQPGDLVVLKSGGPSMTVDTVHDDGVVICMWFSHHHSDTRTETFGAATVEKVE
jgi:uncharacterized protein YodC (DUF2158 family)